MGKLTVKNILDSKGKRMLTLTTAFDAEIAKAAEIAGIDIIVTWEPDTGTLEELLLNIQKVRKGAPNTVIGAGLPANPAYASDAEIIRCALSALQKGADLIYSSGNSIERFAALGKQKIPFVGHVGLIPIQATWFGGMRAVGKTWQEALKVYQDTIAFQEAGAVAVEMECVPHEIAAEITRRVDILTFSLGSGLKCDGQFLFSCDLLGTHDGHYPRHSITYYHFFRDAIKAFERFKEEVKNNTFPRKPNIIEISPDEYELFMENISKN
jgi:3-methyl-2-oxobutanoate hydroxymethyltransferase